MGTLLFISVTAMVGLAVLFAVILSLADKKLQVEENPRIEALLKVLPGANCAACGFASCRAFAEAVATGQSVVKSCGPGGAEVSAKISEIMGQEVEETVKLYARVHCGARFEERNQEANYLGLQTCQAANLIAGGGLACAYGCLGLGDCQQACSFEAIIMREGLPYIDGQKCTGCGNCVAACPRNLITLEPMESDREYLVACRSLDKAKEARRVCKKACIGCGLCVKICPFDALKMEDNLAEINPRNCQQCGVCAIRCPTGAIINLAVYQNWPVLTLPSRLP